MDNNTLPAVIKFATNETLVKQVANFFNVSVANVTNQSEVAQENLFDLYEAYRTREKEQLVMYKTVAYVVGTLIILSNLTVVISSGLILRRGQQPKSTYLLLGNVSLADTIIGFSIIFGALIDNSMNSNPLCIFQIGIFVASLPAMGWTGKTFTNYRCWYVALFPRALLIVVSIVVLSIITMVCVLYFLILHRAVKTVDRIREIKESYNYNIAFVNKSFEATEAEDSSSSKVEEIQTTITIAVSKETLSDQAGNSFEMHDLSKTDEKKQGIDRCCLEKMRCLSSNDVTLLDYNAK
ncbi:hypothetical protein MSG28_006834 [Choristoneura fumiferana]|uniref:Uncharacterized protein n=1 Tax=Choristoneura fumiferana TaxID=7141 RepID=A0ACC0JL82_CHOFU|nr:hypothetical protein MSG28_006834 [Choristoneura fumiferana]